MHRGGQDVAQNRFDIQTILQVSSTGSRIVAVAQQRG
jgi:hypothetical protein